MDSTTIYRIYKYTLRVVDEQYVEMPFEAKMLSVDNQYGDVTLWAKVGIKPQGTTPMRQVKIGIYGTGHDLPTNLHESRFIGTVLTESDQLVWHVWMLS